ncbi:NADH-quinone oxidoreductase subunit M [Nocardiopsis terrae]|uniref:NADH-quinone oxidoreductase subunit M n=1 Tax=Nocardiopsis terrae TaxID=372655 RepID=A0ABR9HMN5_9ACTN|nr:NADH-quinone oxidoreductase subunit M [Nocardiopsis terrae]MBE1460268.1 NADH-quinone oxidoreductase subunit M [Nocardiopsis terrae]GHC70560.1 NADH-quinone oxidoreductase subunit M [Nocardiopsis terrae]
MIPWLTLAIALPAVGAAVIWALPRVKAPASADTAAQAGASARADAGSGTATATRSRPAATGGAAAPAETAKRLALGFSVATLLLVAAMALNFDTSGAGGLQFEEVYPWIPYFGVHFAVGVDGISLVLVLMSVVLVPLVVLAAWNEHSDREDGGRGYFALVLALEAMMIGVFAATDVFLFYVFFEAMLIPVYFMIGRYGRGADSARAAMKFLLYSLAGGLIMLVAVIGVYVVGGTFLWTELTDPGGALAAVDPATARWLFLGFFIAFAIKAPMWPVHTWLPTAAGSSSPGTAVLLVGVLDKVGTYGMLRYCLEMFPAAVSWFVWPVVGLSLVSIVYGAILAIGQSDMMRLVAYTSVSHFGFITLGIFALTQQAQAGAALYMVNHGFATGALFLVVGFLIARRGSSRIEDYGGVQKVAPKLAGVFLVTGLAGLALPGLAPFVSEFLVFVGVYAFNPVPAVIATAGVVLAALYILWMYQRTMTGPTPEGLSGLPDLSGREMWAVAPLVALIIAFGVYPQPMLNVINPAVERTVEAEADTAVAVTDGDAEGDEE